MGFLTDHVAAVRRRLDEDPLPHEELSTRARAAAPALDVVEAIVQAAAREGLAVVAEVKRASPSAGSIAMGADPAVVSMIFVTFTLFRAPLTLIFSLQGRALPYLVGLASSDDRHRLARIVRLVVIGGAGLVILGGLVGWLIGPEVVALLFGEEFAPSATVAMFAAAGVMAAAAAQIAGQVLVAEARTSRLSLAWFGGLTTGVLALLLLGGAPDVRVAIAFAIGEVVALILMAGLAIRR
jgi:O-antigen/teichoic acid export membrane protein